MKELTQLAQRKPILPNIVKIQYDGDIDDRYSTEENQETLKLFFQTLGETCPYLVQ
jgi:hypothetical protein